MAPASGASGGHNVRSLKAMARNLAPIVKSTDRNGLPSGLKAGVERLSGVSLDDVRVHFGSPKPAKIRAHAYAQGSHIHLATGQERHLPHEAWHVVQQKQGRVRATGQIASAPINDDRALEREADVMGARAMAEAKASAARPAQPVAATTGGAVQRAAIRRGDDDR